MKFHGQCWCGNVTFECEGDPLFTQHCHCHKCREVASYSKRAADKIGYSFTAAYLLTNFHVTAKTKLEEWIRNNSTLLLCPECKSQIYGISRDPKLQAGIGINANNFIFSSNIPDSFKPARHIWYADHIVDITDQLPKFRDAPKEQFGTGELYTGQ